MHISLLIFSPVELHAGYQFCEGGAGVHSGEPRERAIKVCLHGCVCFCVFVCVCVCVLVKVQNSFLIDVSVTITAGF